MRTKRLGNTWRRKRRINSSAVKYHRHGLRSPRAREDKKADSSVESFVILARWDVAQSMLPKECPIASPNHKLEQFQPEFRSATAFLTGLLVEPPFAAKYGFPYLSHSEAQESKAGPLRRMPALLDHRAESGQEVWGLGSELLAVLSWRL